VPELSTALKAASEAALKSVAAEAVRILEDKTPASRKRTRAAAFSRVRGQNAVVGLKFRQQYDASGTVTKKRFESIVKTEIVPRIRRSFRRRLAARLSQK
jgi:hypothetical protein